MFKDDVENWRVDLQICSDTISLTCLSLGEDGLEENSKLEDNPLPLLLAPCVVTAETRPSAHPAKKCPKHRRFKHGVNRAHRHEPVKRITDAIGFYGTHGMGFLEQ